MFRIKYILVLSLFLLGCRESAPAQNIKYINAFPQLKFERPVDLQSPRDGSGRLFVLEQAGKIYSFKNDPQTENRVLFLDIEHIVNDRGNEEGLLGLAFHPDYKQNGYFYLNYTAENPKRTVISRYRVSDGNPHKADPQSETVLLEVSQPYSNHNGGQLVFGPDGYLYISFGDGGSAGDPGNNGQNLKTLLGSICRIDVNNQSDGKKYAIPADNPFAGNTKSYRQEIYAYGLRNVWRFSFDRQSGKLWAGDVGQNRIEEIDIIEKGKNYGWNIMEGSECYRSPECQKEQLQLPVHEYFHDVGYSVTGGFVYRGNKIEALQGFYIFADFVTGRIWALNTNTENAYQSRLIKKTSLGISTFGEDENNELYFCAFDGRIYKFINAAR